MEGGRELREEGRSGIEGEDTDAVERATGVAAGAADAMVDEESAVAVPALSQGFGGEAPGMVYCNALRERTQGPVTRE